LRQKTEVPSIRLLGLADTGFSLISGAHIVHSQLPNQFQMRHAPQDRIVRREIAEDIAKAADGFKAAPAVRVEDKRQGPPKLHDLP
jgi:hypothetical protein